MAGWGGELTGNHVGEKRLAHELSAHQGSLKSACAGQGQDLFSRSQTVDCSIPFVCALSP